MCEVTKAVESGGGRASKRALLRQLVAYAFTGGVTTLAYWGTFYLLNQRWHLHPLYSTAAGYLVATVVSYSLHNTLTFQTNDWSSPRQAVTYLIAWIIMLALYLLVMYLLTTPARVHPMAACILTTAIMFPINFFLLKRWVFVRKDG